MIKDIRQPLDTMAKLLLTAINGVCKEGRSERLADAFGEGSTVKPCCPAREQQKGLLSSLGSLPLSHLNTDILVDVPDEGEAAPGAQWKVAKAAK